MLRCLMTLGDCRGAIAAAGITGFFVYQNTDCSVSSSSFLFSVNYSLLDLWTASRGSC
jgi:hypothetical protein